MKLKIDLFGFLMILTLLVMILGAVGCITINRYPPAVKNDCLCLTTGPSMGPDWFKPVPLPSYPTPGYVYPPAFEIKIDTAIVDTSGILGTWRMNGIFSGIDTTNWKIGSGNSDTAIFFGIRGIQKVTDTTMLIKKKPK
jgi:hypothetical protein